jgi:glycosyltransferase involved in cell wall biosynthesis
MIPAFNCGSYLSETLLSVLEQAPGPGLMQITVVDDASTDQDVEDLVRTTGQGRIEYIRQLKNVGSLQNFNTCINQARGRYVHILHSDDRVLPGFYAALEDLFLKNPEAGACFTRYRFIDEKGGELALSAREATVDGVLEQWLERIASQQRIQYVAIAVRRRVYEELGGFFGVTYGEDWEMWVRVASRFPFAYSQEVLAEYRMHSNSISGEKFLTGQNTRDLLWVMQTIQPYLPLECRSSVWTASTAYYSNYGLSIANTLWRDQGNKRAAHLQMMEALHLCWNPSVLWKVLKLYTAILFDRR